MNGEEALMDLKTDGENAWVLANKNGINMISCRAI
jgi:hypothetical protein